MSRSYRKKPFVGFSKHCGDKYFKESYNRKIRSRVKQKLRSTAVEELDDLLLPEKHIEFDDVWNSKNDGKPRYFGDMKCCRTEYNIRMTRTRDELLINEEFLDDIHGYCHPETYEYLRERFLDEGEFTWWTIWYDVIRNTVEEEVKENNEYYKKYMRK